MITLQNVTKTYDNITAVKELSFKTEKGQIFGLLGPNGAGKSTTIKMIMNIHNPDEGSILFNGKPLKKSDGDKIGYLPEERGMYKKTTVKEFITYFGQLKGKSIKELDIQIDYWLEYFNLTEWKERKTEELSKGMRQKIQFVTSIIHDPDIIILDEPFSGLDPVSMDKLREAILVLKERGKTILFSTHVMDQAEKICSHIIILNRGKSIIQGSVSDIKESYGNRSVALEFDGDGSFIESMDEVESIIKYPRFVEVELKEESQGNDFLTKSAAKLSIKRFEKLVPSLHKIFVTAVGEDLDYE